MRKLFENVGNLDKRLVSKFDLSEDLMMEHAANSLNLWIRKNLKKDKKVQILCGPGNNGADGIATARMLYKDYKISILLPLQAKSNMAKIQLKRAKKLGIKIDTKLNNASLFVDALFGSGLDRELSEDIVKLIKKVNAKVGLKLSCDVPTGIMQNGNVSHIAFKADTTITMGSLKTSLFGDEAKEYVGVIKVCDLGVSRKVYEGKTYAFLLQKSDLKLPIRLHKNTNKGSFGHLAIVAGEKQGASKLTAKAAFSFGVGLVSMIGEGLNLPDFLMQSKNLPTNSTAIACGMGLGKLTNNIKELLVKTPLPLLLDADILVCEDLKQIIENKKNIILTPHLKEFSLMSKILGFGDFTISQIQANKFKIAREFSLKFPQILVLKGSNTIIANNGKYYVSSYGEPSLSKGGSGDILSGLIASLLAQKYSLIDSAISGVLAHGLSSKKFNKQNYSLTPHDIIKGVKCL